MSSSKKIAIFFIVLLLATGLAAAGSYQGAKAFDLPLLAIIMATSIVIQWIAFIPAHIFQTEKYFDLIGGSTYILVTLLAVSLAPQLSVYTMLMAAMIIVWAGRLAAFLSRRVHKKGKDGRFDEIKKDFMRHLNLWTIQGLWVGITAGAALTAITSLQMVSNPALFIFGALVWLAGFSIETVSDHQKTQFRADPENQDKFIQHGLWSWSRHPNYLGEITLWIGMAIMAVQYLIGWQFFTLISPLFVIVLLTKISGVNMLEDRADKKWGGEADYEAYKSRVGVLLPKIGRETVSNAS
jgi:steroid 5-alpha reductase family enzyme